MGKKLAYAAAAAAAAAALQADMAAICSEVVKPRPRLAPTNPAANLLLLLGSPLPAPLSGLHVLNAESGN